MRVARTLIGVLVVLALAGCGGAVKHPATKGSGVGKGIPAAISCLKAAGIPQVGVPTELNDGPVPLAQELTVPGGVIDATNSGADAAKLAQLLDVGVQPGGPATVEGNVVVHGAKKALSGSESSALARCGTALQTTSVNAPLQLPTKSEASAQGIRKCVAKLGIDVESESPARGVPGGGQYLGLFPNGGAIAGGIDIFSSPAPAVTAATAQKANPYFAGVVTSKSGKVVFAYAQPLAGQAAAIESCIN